MDRLWVKLSLAITAYTLLMVLLPTFLFFAVATSRLPMVRDNPLFDHEFEFDRHLNEDRPNRMPIPIERSLWEVIPRGFVVLSLGVGIFGLVIGVLVSRGISRPIAELAVAATRVGAGELGYHVKITRHSRELNDLSEAFNKMSADLHHAEQLRTNLMADVSHELRTPLTVLEGNLRAALDRVYQLDEADLANLYSQTRHLIRLVNDLRELTLAEANQLPLHYEQVDLRELVREVMWNWELVAEEQGVALRTELESPLPIISADAGRLRQLFNNLLDNALRYTPPKGSVTVRGAVEENQLVLRVSDTGIGIPSDQLPSLFNRFYRVDRSRTRESGGSGLGLAIAKGIVELHGGKISAESMPNQGTTFTISFPLP